LAHFVHDREIQVPNFYQFHQFFFIISVFNSLKSLLMHDKVDKTLHKNYPLLC
jgi:hypothetical protein